ncbi:MAG: hypothetical protein NC429_02810 [Lachnospiraceae bacterium]|nr:hypothetical protein [Lachnospiraceae bacterium]
MKLLYATQNPAKVTAMRNRLEGLGIELIGLRDLNQAVPDVIEDGSTPLENALKKAAAYYEAFRIPLFSCDSGLYFDEIPEELQPGIHVRTINGRYLTDEEMLEYYSSLAARYGNLTARYRNAVCLILDKEHVYSAMDESMASVPFLITSKPHAKRNKGFPLDSLSIDIRTGKYYYDLENKELDQVAVEDGFIEFFAKYCTGTEEEPEG